MSDIKSTITIQDRATATIDKIASGFDRLANGAQAMSAKVNKSGSMMKSMLGANLIGNAITSGVGAAKNAIGGLIGDLDEASATWQTFNSNMANIGMSSGAIASTKKDLQQFAQQTIYSASDMASTYSQLAAVGTKNTTQLVKGFGGLAAASAEPAQAMTTLSQQATQMAAKPKVAWEDFKLMLEQSPAGMSAVAKTMGKTTSQLITSIQDGKVKTQDFFNAVTKAGTSPAFTEMATKFKTVGQAVDGLKETVTNKLQGAFDSASQKGIKFVSDFTDALDGINVDGIADKVFGAFEKIQQGISNFKAGFTAALSKDDLAGAFDGIKEAASHIAQALTGTKSGADAMAVIFNMGVKVAAGINVAARAVEKLTDWLSSLDPSTIQTVAKVVVGGLGAFIAFKVAIAGAAKAMKAMQAVSGVVKGIKGLTGAIPAATGPLGTMAGKTKEAGQSAGQSATNFMKMGAGIAAIGVGVMTAAVGLAIIAKSAIQLAEAGPGAVATFVVMGAVLGGLIAVVGIFGKSLTAAAQGMLAFGATILMIGAAVRIAAPGIQALSGLVKQLGNSISQVIAAVAAALPQLADAISTVVGSVSDLIGQIGDSISKVVQTIGDSISGVIDSISSGISGVLDSIAGIISSIGESARNAGTGVKSMAAGFKEMASVGVIKLGAILTEIAAGLGKVASSGAGVSSAGTGISKIASSAQAALTALNGLKSIGDIKVNVSSASMGPAVAAIRAGAVSAVNAAKTTLNQLPNVVRSAVSRAASAARSGVGAMRSAGSMIGAGLAAGMRSQIGAVTAAANALIAQADRAARAAAKIHSPSRLFAEIGDYMGQGLANGMNSTNGLVTNAGTAMAGAAIAGVGDLHTGTGSYSAGTVSSAPAGLTAGGGTTTTTSNSSKTLNIQQGAIVINAADIKNPAELVATIEAYLKRRAAEAL